MPTFRNNILPPSSEYNLLGRGRPQSLPNTLLPFHNYSDTRLLSNWRCLNNKPHMDIYRVFVLLSRWARQRYRIESLHPAGTSHRQLPHSVPAIKESHFRSESTLMCYQTESWTVLDIWVFTTNPTLSTPCIHLSFATCFDLLHRTSSRGIIK